MIARRLLEAGGLSWFTVRDGIRNLLGITP
jgi:hypothetical protein